MSHDSTKTGNAQLVLAWHGSVGSESSGEESNVVVIVTSDLGVSSSDP